MTPAAQAAKRALSAHDLDHAEHDVYERLAEAVYRFGSHLSVGDVELAVGDVAEALDCHGLAVYGAPETQAAARDVVAAVKAVGT